MELDDLLGQKRELYEKMTLVKPRSGDCLSFKDLESSTFSRDQKGHIETCERCKTLHERLLAAMKDRDQEAEETLNPPASRR